MQLTLKVFTDRAEADAWAQDNHGTVEECTRVKYRPVSADDGSPQSSKIGATRFAVIARSQ